jgi:hypothetical protein
LINLRYHIVSITAVFLALGIGLTLGTSFLDRVTVDTLKQQLDDVEQRVQETDQQNGELSARVEALDERDDALVAGIGRVVEGRLADVPVLVLATEGTEQADVDAAVATLASSGAEVAGTWWLTERWALDDDEEVQALADALAITSEDPERLFLAGTARLAQELADAALPPEPVADDAEVLVDPAAGEEGTDTADDAAADPAAGDPAAGGDDEELVEVVPPSEPELLAELAAAGFVEYQALPGSGDERVLLPAAGTRYVVVSGQVGRGGPQQAASTVVATVAEEDVLSVVAAQGDTALQLADEAPAPEDDRRTTFVGPLRTADVVRERVTTIDHLDTAAGLLAMVLAVDDLDLGVVGHYGVAPGAAGLVPGPPST